MVRQYPHFLFIEEAAVSSQDANGNWSEGGTSIRFLSACREESDGKGTEYQVAGGEYIKATSVIQCPKSCPKIEKGARVLVANDMDCSDVRISGVCLNVDMAQLHTRLWV